MSGTQNKLIWFNGKVIPSEEAKVHVLSHGLHYGSSVFEGIRVYKTPYGPQVFRLSEHIQRLFDSAKIYRMHIPFSQEVIETACKAMVIKNDFESAYLRPIAFYGEGAGLGVKPKDIAVDVAIAALDWGAYLGADALTEGIDVCVTSWSRLAPNTMPTGAKAGGNYLSSQLISMEAKRHGYHEGIGLDVNGMVSEGAGENLFVIRNNIFYTPPVSGSILPGITRDTVINFAEKLGYEVRREFISRESLYIADEIFMTGTAAEITPVRSVDQIQIGSGKSGCTTKKIQEMFFGLFSGETKDEWNWLTLCREK